MYGHALALSRSGRNTPARDLARNLLEQYPNHAEFIILDAELDTKLGATEEAVRKLQASVGLHPDSPPLRIAYAEALIKSGKHRRALATLEDFVRLRPGSTTVYQLMADAALKSGQKAATHRYRGEKLYLEGDLEPAIRQMQLALRSPGLSFHEASQIQVRLSALKEEEESEKERKKF
jgi:predicted Zn-dependent protease